MRRIPIRHGVNAHESLKGLYVVISGATGGTGMVVLEELKDKSAIPIILHRRESFVNDSELHMIVDYDDLSSFPAQFSEFLSEKQIPEESIAEYYSLHGCGHFDRFSELEPEFIKSYLNANILSHVLLTRYFLSLDNVKRICTVSSVCGHFPAQYFSLYGGSKAFLESLYTSLSSHNKCNSVVARPAAVLETRFLEEKEMVKAGIVGKITNLRLIAVCPKEVADVIINAPPGVHSVGWINFLEDIAEIFPRLYRDLVKLLHMPIKETNQSKSISLA